MRGLPPGILSRVSDGRVGVEEFGPVASFYDVLMKGVPYRMWVGYYLLLLSKQGAKPKELLDVCCGTGTLCEMLTAEGFRVEGLDLSAPMIEIARAKAAEKSLDIRYEVADASNFSMGRTYDAAYSFFDSLNYITTAEGLFGALKSVAAHLPSGASWVFDLNTEYAFTEDMFTQKKLSPKAAVRYDWKGNYDPRTRIIHVDMAFWVDGVEHHEVHVQRAHDMWEVREMLGDAGFTDIDVYHSYTLDPPRAKSDRIHFACIRQ